jgi:hypothetical protein
MDVGNTLIGLAIGGAAALVGKIVWDWLKGNNSRAFFKSLIDDLKKDIKQEIKITMLEVEKKMEQYVTWNKWDSFKEGYDEFKQDFAALKAKCENKDCKIKEK